jgi:hypothetical protein
MWPLDTPPLSPLASAVRSSFATGACGARSCLAIVGVGLADNERMVGKGQDNSFDGEVSERGKADDR